MILRRLTRHVKDQNWFAVALDFLIVVSGILLAFQITNWSEVRRENANLARAEIALTEDLLDNYLVAKVHVAVTQCRMDVLSDLGARLLQEGDEWEAAPSYWDQDWFAFALAVDVPKRAWKYRVWDAELARGSFDRMDLERRDVIDDIFAYVELMETYTLETTTSEAELKILGQTTVLSRPERNRLFALLATLDQYGASLGQIGGIIFAQTQTLDLQLTPEQRSVWRDRLTDRNERSLEQYSDYFQTITLPFLDPSETGDTP